jgi:hypothetical protein
MFEVVLKELLAALTPSRIKGSTLAIQRTNKSAKFALMI